MHLHPLLVERARDADALPRAWALDYGGTEWHQSIAIAMMTGRAAPAGSLRHWTRRRLDDEAYHLILRSYPAHRHLIGPPPANSDRRKTAGPCRPTQVQPPPHDAVGRRVLRQVTSQAVETVSKPPGCRDTVLLTRSD